MSISAIIGLGNPGPQFTKTRHNIGFMVLDALAERYHTSFKKYENAEIATISINNKPVLLIKPQTFMNDSGKVMSWVRKKNIAPEQILVIHDELELPFGVIKLKEGGSAKGHNGLRSLIAHGAQQCKRLRMGIGRPEHKEEVPDYVLQRFKESQDSLVIFINEAITFIETL